MRFYATYDDAKAKRKRLKPTGVFIVFNENGFAICSGNRIYSGCGTVFEGDSNQICGSTASSGWLATCCRRISRRTAEEISPRMMAAFDASERREREAQRRIKKGEK